MVQAAHPMAGASGIGPPVAPANWKWRCGNRLRDMYFYPPSGKQIRSRTELAAFLGKLPNPPSPNEFCWRVTAEIVNSGTWNQEEEEGRTPKRQAIPARRGKKRKSSSPEGSDADPKSTVEEGEGHITKAVPISVRAPATVGSKKVTPPTARAKARAKRRTASYAAPPEEVTHSFKDILKENSSFMWLRNESVSEAFLEEAGRLDEMSAAEIKDMRDVLVSRNLQTSNLTKYPNKILRIFVRILGVDGLREDPTDSVGKVELASLCIALSKTSAPPA